jgi:OFA family oxalate/formate antiporter-like MFS transporter
MAEIPTASVPAGKRWLIVVGALLIQLCLGAIYGWGAFTMALQNKPADVAMALSPTLLGVKDQAAYDDKKQQYSTLSTAVKKAETETDKTVLGKAKDEMSSFLLLIGYPEPEFSTKKVELDALKAAVKDAEKATKDAADKGALVTAKAALKTFTDDKELAQRNRAWIETTFDAAKFDQQVFAFSAKNAQWPFSVGLAVFALVMIFAGRWQDKAGPRVVALTGGVVLGLGYVLASLVGTSFPLMILCIGVIGGAGIGLGYVCPIAASVKWFPDMKGFITGLAVAGFGAGAFIFIKLSADWASLIRNYGVSTTFLVFGIIFLVGVVLGALLLSNPPPGYKPAGWTPAQKPGAAKLAPVTDLSQGQTIRTPQFWMIWLAFVLSSGCGLMVIGSLKNFGEKEGGLSAAVAASAIGLLALFNGLGRVVWGTLSQKLTARGALVLMVFLQALMMLLLPRMGSSELMLAIAACWIGFNFGGNFALFPLLTAESFGTKNLGANYGVVFTSYGVGGILGPMLAGGVWDAMGTYQWAFVIASIACVVSGVIALLIRRPKAELRAADCIMEVIMANRSTPADCTLFGVKCTPETPQGAAMSDPNGKCAVAYREKKSAAKPV